jgi:predicted peptidase
MRTPPVRLFILTLLLAPIAGCANTSFLPDAVSQSRPGTGFQTQSAFLNGHEKKFTVYLPDDYTPGRRYPTILFLHGVFAGGSDGTRPVAQGLGEYIAKHPKSFPFIVLFPQSPVGFWTRQSDRDDAVALLDHARSLYSIDPDRISLIGVSAGGHGAWRIAAAQPNRFCALVTFSGQSAPIPPENLVHLPIRCYHYLMDPLVGSYQSLSMVQDINRAGGHAQLTTVDGFGHYVWERVYGDPFFAWLMEQRRQPLAPQLASHSELTATAKDAMNAKVRREGKSKDDEVVVHHKDVPTEN